MVIAAPVVKNSTASSLFMHQHDTTLSALCNFLGFLFCNLFVPVDSARYVTYA